MGSHELIAAYSVSEAYMIGEVEVENVKAIMDVSLSLPLPLLPFPFSPTCATRSYPRRPPRRLLFLPVLLVLVFALHLTLALVPRR